MVPPVELPVFDVAPVMPERFAYTVPADAVVDVDGEHVYPAGHAAVFPVVMLEVEVEAVAVVLDWPVAGVVAAVVDVTLAVDPTDEVTDYPPEADPDTVLVTIDEVGTVPIAVVMPQVVA